MPVDKMQHAVSQKDIADFKQYEKEIEEDQAAFLRVGERLIEIRDRKLYLIMYDTFEEYVRERWGWSRQRAYQLINATAVMEALPEECQRAVDTEFSARELSKVPENIRESVIEEAQKNGAVTAVSIHKAAKKVTAPPPKPSSKPAPKPEKEPHLDCTDYPIPDNLIPLFDRTQEVRELLTRLASVRGACRRLADSKDQLWQPVDFSSVILELDKAYSEMKLAWPYAVCTYCQGHDDTRKNCTSCKGRGVLSEFMWKNAVPESIKSVRAKSNK